ncbi:MAG: FixH family protein [Caulobacterales bacterium]|nr:FixH family protein [Caulobacterales bacterium]
MAPAADVAASGFRLTGWHVLAIIVAFFLVVIAVDTSFAVIAYRTHPGEVSVTPYEDGLVYDREIRQMHAQEALGWQAAAAAEPGRVVVQMRDRSGAPIRGLKIAGKLERPATEAGRLVAQFSEVSPGVYASRVPAAPGAWDLSAEAVDGGGRVFKLERRLTWR